VAVVTGRLARIASRTRRYVHVSAGLVGRVRQLVEEFLVLGRGWLPVSDAKARPTVHGRDDAVPRVGVPSEPVRRVERAERLGIARDERVVGEHEGTGGKHRVVGGLECRHGRSRPVSLMRLVVGRR
jgi:hypothetical protein